MAACTEGGTDPSWAAILDMPLGRHLDKLRKGSEEAAGMDTGVMAAYIEAAVDGVQVLSSRLACSFWIVSRGAAATNGRSEEGLTGIHHEVEVSGLGHKAAS